MLADRYAAERIRAQLDDPRHAWWVAQQDQRWPVSPMPRWTARTASSTSCMCIRTASARASAARCWHAVQDWARAQHARRLWLQVNRGNTQAIAAYRKLGLSHRRVARVRHRRRLCDGRPCDGANAVSFHQSRRRRPARAVRPHPDHCRGRPVAAARAAELPRGAGDAALRLSHRAGAAAGGRACWAKRPMRVSPTSLSRSIWSTCFAPPNMCPLSSSNAWRYTCHPSGFRKASFMTMPRSRAQAGGMTVVMDRCLLKEYVRLNTEKWIPHRA